MYEKKVYDITRWLPKHPGGRNTLLRFLGMDVTDEVQAFHDAAVIQKYLPLFVIGYVLDPVPVSAIQEDFRRLGTYFEQRDFFAEPDYLLSCIWLMLWWFVAVTSWQINLYCSAVLLGLFWQQAAFVCHDIGHGSASRTIGRLLGNVLSGVTLEWWNSTHNTHHAVPNSIPDDPDVNHLPVFCLHRQFFTSIYCSYHQCVMRYNWLAQHVFIPYQHVWYYPLMAVSRVNLYFQSARFGFTKTQVCFFVWYSYLLSHFDWWAALQFHLLSHAVAGILHVQITLSHFSCPLNAGISVAYGGDFYTRNLMASLDIQCHPAMDWFHGGLQFQTVHHLYPRLRRQHFREAQLMVKTLCQRHQLPYTAISFWAANGAVYRRLTEIAWATQRVHPVIWDSMHARG
jgi:delta8-fatty-acid desaturase